MDSNLIAAHAAASAAEWLFDLLRDLDPDGLKRALDQRREQIESRLAKQSPGGDEPERAVAQAELGLLHRLFRSLA